MKPFHIQEELFCFTNVLVLLMAYSEVCNGGNNLAKYFATLDVLHLRFTFDTIGERSKSSTFLIESLSNLTV